jgi:hypothetical protein
VAGRRAGGGGDRGGRGHIDSHVTGASHSGYDARRRIEEIRRKKSSTASENDGFPAFSARLRNLLLQEKIQASRDHQVRCEARPSPMAQMLRSLH